MYFRQLRLCVVDREVIVIRAIVLVVIAIGSFCCRIGGRGIVTSGSLSIAFEASIAIRALRCLGWIPLPLAFMPWFLLLPLGCWAGTLLFVEPEAAGCAKVSLLSSALIWSHSRLHKVIAAQLSSSSPARRSHL